MIKLYNTLSCKEEIFIPIDPINIRLYVCGPTVYNRVHLGNVRLYVIFDILYRLLKLNFFVVCYVRNITDIDDKIINYANLKGITITDVTKKTIEMFSYDMEFIGNILPSIEPRATQHIYQMINTINLLIKRGCAYELDGHVLFNIKKFINYGKLSGKKETSKKLYKIVKKKIFQYKISFEDFVLWKPSYINDPGWGSPWGFGRPGWHIECSSMSQEYLGKKFDFHGGGADLIFPHHENEMAQSISIDGYNAFAQVWLHVGMLTINNEKMSKSLNNILTINDMLKIVSGESIRYLFLSTHYRYQLNWTKYLLKQADILLNKFYFTLSKIEFLYVVEFLIKKIRINYEIKSAIYSNLNTPLALSKLHLMRKVINKTKGNREQIYYSCILLCNARFLGFLKDFEMGLYKYKIFNNHNIKNEIIVFKVRFRLYSKIVRNYIISDIIREDLQAQKIFLEDTSHTTNISNIK